MRDLLKNTFNTLALVGWGGLSATHLFETFFNQRPVLGGLVVILSLSCIIGAAVMAIVRLMWERRYTFQSTFLVLNGTLDAMLNGEKAMDVSIVPAQPTEESEED
jgi:urea transporter